MRHFSLLKLHIRKINWWSFHGVFECYNHGELEYSKKDFATRFLVRLYLLIEIYLLYIQFIVYSIYCGHKFSINLIVVIFISQWIFFGAVPWFSPLYWRVFHVRFGVLVWLCLYGACQNFFCFHNISIAWQLYILIHKQTLRGLKFFPNIRMVFGSDL